MDAQLQRLLDDPIFRYSIPKRSRNVPSMSSFLHVVRLGFSLGVENVEGHRGGSYTGVDQGVNLSKIFPVDKWPERHEPFPGVVREAYYTYSVPPDEPTAALTFSDEGDKANANLKDTHQVAVELAVLPELDFDACLANIISAVTEPIEPVELPIDQVIGHLTNRHLVICHPNLPAGIRSSLKSRNIPVAEHVRFPAANDQEAILILCMGQPGLIVRADSGSGAFVFPGRFAKVRATLASNTVWDRLLRGSDLLTDD